MMFKAQKKPLALIVMASTLGLSATAQSQGPILEEIVVTATKRAVGMQDVPIALSVMTGEKMSDMGLKELSEMSVYVPNVHIGESGSAQQIFIRGVGSGNNQGFEQSVGMFVDGVYNGRARNSRAAFLDVERVEVLKGPQSTLFGKNTIAGAINITTKRASDEFEGSVEANYNDDLGGYGVTGIVSGPLSDSLRARLVAKTYEHDGWMENSASDGTGNSKEDQVVRAILDWDVSEDLTLSIKAEEGRFKREGSSAKITLSTPTSDWLFSGADENFTATTGFNTRQSVQGFDGRDIADDTDSSIFQITADYQLGEHNLRSISAYTDYEYTNCVDADYSPLSFVDRCRQEGHEQVTQEFLLSSPTGGTIEYLTGAFYQSAKLKSDSSTLFAIGGVPAVEAGYLPTGQGLYNYLSGVAGLPAKTLMPGDLDSEYIGEFSQDSTTWSVFGEVTYHVSDRFRTTLGLRYSNDTKTASKSQRTIAPGSDAETSDVFLGALGSALNVALPYEYLEERKEDHWTGNINLQLDLNADAMAYLNISNGYKAGGYDADNAMDVSREFEDESVVAVELGLKAELWQNRLRLNTSVFSSDYSNMQVSGFETAGFVVGNAAKSKVRGLETDVVVALTDTVTLNAAFAYLDASFEEHDAAACSISQDLDGSCDANGGFQSLSGASMQFAPELAGNLGISFNTPLSDLIELAVQFDALYSDDIMIAPDNDSAVIQPAYWKFNARAAVESSGGEWMVALVGKNLTDKTTFNWGNDATTSGMGLGFENAYFHHIEAPRTLEIQGRYNF